MVVSEQKLKMFLNLKDNTIMYSICSRVGFNVTILCFDFNGIYYGQNLCIRGVHSIKID